MQRRMDMTLRTFGRGSLRDISRRRDVLPVHRALSIWLLVAFCLVAACSGGAPKTAGRVHTPGCGARGADRPGTFFAVMPWANSAVDAVALLTGKPVCQVAPANRDGLTVSGVSRTNHGSLLVTYSRGPACTSGVNGCGPKPHTCGAEVVEVALSNGHSAVVWRVGRDELLRDAALSPDGTTVVAKASPCVPSYFNDHLLVRVAATGRSWTIGAGVPRCHWIGAPSWTSDGHHVLITYAAPEGMKPYTGADGTCTEFGDASLVRVDATRPSAQITGDIARPPHGCTWSTASVAATATYAIQACGSRIANRLDGSVRLVQLDTALRPVRHWLIGACTDGNNVAADAIKGVILSAYLFCNPPPKGQKLRDPITVLDQLVGGQLRRIASAGGGATNWDALTW